MDVTRATAAMSAVAQPGRPKAKKPTDRRASTAATAAV
jgi:hypothetical protein